MDDLGAPQKRPDRREKRRRWASWRLAAVSEKKPQTNPTYEPEGYKEMLAKPLRAAVAFFVHLVLLWVLVLGVYATEKGLGWFWPDEQPSFFGGRLPPKYFFEAADTTLFVVFITFGTVDAINKLRGK